jgi:peptidoglycan/LPS O-acetylase OafA/YrhL
MAPGEGRPPSGALRTGDRLGFRPDLEGLRAVAVGLVILYHARAPWFPGGYVGVDVFFVLSGFLITGILVRELEAEGRISLPRFYARRARRLLPAAALVLLATAVASVILLPPLQLPDVGGDIAAAAAYASNLRFAFQATDYLASELPPSPVLHYWSLGVEEQFYLFWPALLAVVAGAAFVAGDRVHGIRRITSILILVLVASAALSVWLTGVQQPWAFFSLPTRAWELALGGLLAMPLAARYSGFRVTPIAGWIGLGLIVGAGVALNDGTAFPGVAAFLPTAGCALLIWSGLGQAGAAADATAAGTDRLPAPQGLLSLPFMRYIGRISYSLYLWHWPVLVLPAAAIGDLTPALRAGLVGLVFILAAATQRWVEEPFRRGRVVGDRPRRVLAFAGATTIAVVLSAAALGGFGLRELQPDQAAGGGPADQAVLPSFGPVGLGPAATGAGPDTPDATLPPLAPAPVPGDLQPALTAARADLPVIYSDGCHLGPAATQPGDCIFGDPTSKTTVVLFGDSHAAEWFPALERLSLERDWRLVSLTKSGCASADVDVWSELYNRPYTECSQWRELAFDRIARERPALVVISNARHYSLAIDGAMAWSTDHEDVWSAGLRATIERVAADGAAIAVIGDTVRQDVDPPTCLSRHLSDASACASPYPTAVAVNRHELDEQVAAATGATFIDPTPWMCFTDPCPTVIGRFLVYRDTHHLTATYARALAELLAADLPRIGS